jgi:hypothetical protein
MATTLVIALGPLTTLDAVLISHTHPIVTSEINHLLETCHGMSYTCVDASLREAQALQASTWNSLISLDLWQENEQTWQILRSSPAPAETNLFTC